MNPVLARVGLALLAQSSDFFVQNNSPKKPFSFFKLKIFSLCVKLILHQGLSKEYFVFFGQIERQHDQKNLAILGFCDWIIYSGSRLGGGESQMDVHSLRPRQRWIHFEVNLSLFDITSLIFCKKSNFCSKTFGINLIFVNF